MKLVKCIVAAILICFSNIFSFGNKYSDDNKTCRNISSGKKPGHSYVNVDHEISAGKPDIIGNAANLSICSLQCIQDLKCQIAEYNKNTLQCKLYYNIYKAERDPSGEKILFYWEFCNLSDGMNVKELAKGFWFYDIDVKIHVEDHIQSIFISYLSCQAKCSENPLCGGFNYYENSSKCQLLKIWSKEYRSFKPYKNCRGYYWVLQDPIKYYVKDEYCRHIKTKDCVGKWNIVKWNNIFNISSIIVFQTRNFLRCYRSCEYYAECTKIYFIYSISTCVLQGNLKCSKLFVLPRKNIIIVEWKCCDRGIKMNFGRYKIMSLAFRKCYEIRHPKYVALLSYKCSEKYKDGNENCTSTKKQYSLNCYFNQCFQSTGKYIGKYLVIFNGYQSFLLKNDSKPNFILTNYESCELYNAEIPKDPVVSIIPPQDWYSIYTNETNLNMSLPIKRIIVGVLNHKGCLCFEWLHCVEVIRSYQNFIHKKFKINIQFHFMISANGEIFEGRGWNQQNKVKKMPNAYMYFFAFLGNFYSNNPTIESMRSFKKLIGYGVSKKYIDEKYSLITAYDYNKIDYKDDFFKLFNVIRTQARYNNLQKEDCLQISYVTSLLNILCMLSVTAILSWMSSLLYSWGHSKSCNILRTSNDEQYLLNISIYPISNYIKVLLNYNMDFKDFIKTEIKFLEISNTTIFCITELPGRLKCIYCEKKILQYFTILQKRNENIDVFQLKLLIQHCSNETICFIFPTQLAFLKTILIIVHLPSFDIVSRLKNIISSVINGKCICSSFNAHKLKVKIKNNKLESI